MDVTRRTAFVAGGTSGIGLGLARRLSLAGSEVVVGGRRRVTSEQLAPEGLRSVTVDIADAPSVLDARDEVLALCPGLDTVVAMSGIVVTEDLRDPAHITAAEAQIATNLLGTIRLIDAFLPHLLSQGAGAILTVSSIGAFVPLPSLPTYAASKAAVHAYTLALRAQLRGTGIEVIELIPPPVATTRDREVANPDAVPLPEFLDEVMGLLAEEPTPPEIVVDRARAYRHAERDGTLEALLDLRGTPPPTAGS